MVTVKCDLQNIVHESVQTALPTQGALLVHQIFARKTATLGVYSVFRYKWTLWVHFIRIEKVQNMQIK